jgi:hypothetical protein
MNEREQDPDQPDAGVFEGEDSFSRDEIESAREEPEETWDEAKEEGKQAADERL